MSVATVMTMMNRMTAIDYCAAEFNVDFVHILYTEDKNNVISINNVILRS